LFDFSPIQIMLVLAIALIVFGPKRLPELARSVGKGVREFKGAIAMDDEPASKAPPAAARTGSAPASAASSSAAPAAPPADGVPAPPAAPSEPEVLEGIVVSGDDQPPGAR
jgi:TatA/E family protein of Tat protein translocase